MRLLIKRTRIKKGIKIKHIIKEAGISRASLYNYENGKRWPDMLTMEKLAKAMNVKISDLYESEYK